jgi:hypothetical protein
VPAVIDLLRNGLRLAVAAVLSLAVLLAGSGIHPTSHCDDHAGSAVHADVDGCGGDEGQAEDDGDGLCLSCDCSCQSLHPGVVVTLTVPEAQVVGRVVADGPPEPEEVFLELDPPPVRAS